MQYIVQPVLEKGANHPTFSVNYSGKTYALANVRSRLVLQADGAALGQASWSEGTSGQRWKLQRLADGRYKICCASVTSYCLDASTPTEVKVANSSDSEAQKWELVPMGGAVYHIRSSTAGKALAESGGRFVLADEYLPVDDSAEEAQKNPEQKFVLAEIQANALAETYGKAISIHTDIEHRGEQRSVALGKYDNGVPGERVWRMRNLGSGNYLGLNNEGGGRQDAAQAVGWLATQWRQIFRIEPVPGTSHYRILEVETGLVLALGTTDPTAGTDVKGFPASSNPLGDRWEIWPRQGCFLIVAAGTKLAMEHYHVANEEWVELREVAPERGDAQRWVLEDETAWEVDTTKEFKIYNSKAGKWLYAESDTVPRVGAWSDSSRQLWRLTKVQRTADGRQIYAVVSAHPEGKALSMPDVANDQPLTLGGANDKWHVTRMDGGAFRLRAEGVGGGVRFDMSTRGPGDAEGLVTAYQEVWNEHGANQEWVLIDKRECTIVPGARYAIISDAGLALTDEPGADSQHGTVTLREADNRPQQAWRFLYDAVTEAFSVVVSNTANTNLERVLEVEDDSMAEGARVQTNDRRVQQWRPASYVGQQKYTLASRGSGLVLDATSDQDGCDIVQWSANGERHQTFHLVELHDGRTISTEGVVTLDFTPVTIKSIKVPAGLRVTLYDGPRLTGATRVLLEDAQDLGAFKVASMFVEPVVTLRSGGGATWYLGMGEYTKAALGDLGVGYGVLSSIDVPQGMQVELFDADDFAGEQRVISFGAPSLADVGVGAVQSIRVKAAGVVVPREALRYGDVISLRAQRSDTGQLAVKPDRPWPLVAWGDGGPQTQFRVVRAGTTRFKDLVCYGDVIGLQSLHAKDAQGYLYVSVASSGATKCEYQGPQAPAQFVLVRAASGTSRTFVSRGDVLALFNESTKLYISANDGQGQELKAMGELKSWEGWKVDQVWPVDAPSAATQSASVDGSPSVEAVQSPSFLEPGSPGSFSPLRLVGPRWAVGPSERSITCVEDACGAAVCVADGGMLSVCGAAATGVGYCAVDITAVGACGAAFALQAICGVDVAGLGLCGTAASGVALCGADLCGAAACGAAACGGALCGAAACGSNAGNGMCGVDTCSVDGSIVNACPADICGANACLINLCPADVCAADACLIDLIPVIPGI